MEIDKILNGIEVTISFYYEPHNPGHHNRAPEAGFVIIEDILHKGQSIYEIISKSIVEQLEDKIYQELSKE